MKRLEIRDGDVLCEAARARLAECFEVVDTDPDVLLLTLPKPLTDHDYGPHLDAIGTCTTGVQHLDAAACERYGIKLVSLEGDPMLNTLTGVAEHTFGLIWMLLRFGGRPITGWDRTPHVAPFLLSRASLGVVGLGRIGAHVAQLASAYGMKVRINEDAWGCDIVSLHLPLNGQTESMVDAALLARMKRGAYLVNTARGELVDDQAVLDALHDSQLAGYGADVLSGEFAPGFDCRAHPLWQAMLDGMNVVLTPHIGGSTLDSWEATQLRIIERLFNACSL